MRTMNILAIAESFIFCMIVVLAHFWASSHLPRPRTHAVFGIVVIMSITLALFLFSDLAISPASLEGPLDFQMYNLTNA